MFINVFISHTIKKDDYTSYKLYLNYIDKAVRCWVYVDTENQIRANLILNGYCDIVDMKHFHKAIKTFEELANKESK